MFPPSIELAPVEFEQQVAPMFAAYAPTLETTSIRHLVKIQGTDGIYEIDVLVTFAWMGLSYRTLVECKNHKNPIKRDDVQVLQSRLQSTGSQKGVVLSTSGFQKGAIEYAQAHGIALVQIVTGELIYQTRSAMAYNNRPQSPVKAAGYLVEINEKGNIGGRLIMPDQHWLTIDG